jgi:hypothetical protein
MVRTLELFNLEKEKTSYTIVLSRSDTRTVSMKADDDDDAPVEVGMEFGTSGELANLKDTKEIWV